MKVSLFPFLPVLLCMMGAMIMLLVVVARNVREQTLNPTAAQQAQTMTAEEATELEAKIAMRAEDADWHAERYVIARQEAEAGLADYQTRLAIAEKETQRIKDEILRLEQLGKQLNPQTSATPEEVEHLKRLLAAQQQRKIQAESELAELQKTAAQQGKSYAIVPSRAANGTFRRPIYIECGNDKIIIQPEGVELVPSDFMVLERPDNPFDSVLRAIRQYYSEMEPTVRGNEPYPLMIVRPSGVEIYEQAYTRMVNGGWIKDFGYEIVNEDWNIQYPEPNEELRRRILQQLETSRHRLQGYMMAMQRAGQPAPQYGMGYGTGNGGNGNMPQQFRTNHQGHVIPVGNEIRNAEDLQRYLEVRRQAAGKETFSIEGRAVEREGYSVPGEKPGYDVGVGVTVGAERQIQGDPSLRPQDGAVKDMTQFAKDMTTNKATADGRRQTAGQEAAGGRRQEAGGDSSQRPQNWGLKDATQFTKGISRTVKIRCESERFVLSAQPGLPRERAIPISGTVAEAADQLVAAIWEFQESWGKAGENVYWKPILQVRVATGGERRLQELKQYLRNSGLVIEEIGL